ncbi:hypothetical protein AnigIFM63326_006795 [Aspergillus niger]|nr:hypothetical protein AnigIFM63326_006795 [Aspergillus niger]
MIPSHRSASQLWAIARRKLFTRREPKSSEHDYPQHRSFDSVSSSSFSEHTDGFYKYSLEVLQQSDEEYRDTVESRGMRSSDSTGMSYTSARTAPAEFPFSPYAVGAVEWNSASGYVKNLDDAQGHDVSSWKNSVLAVYVRVYTVAKVVFMSFIHYGIELDGFNGGLMVCIRDVEDAIASTKIAPLVECVEKLYHALYARLVMELVVVDLCSCFKIEVSRVSSHNNFMLPEPRHLYNIFLACKQVLDSSTVCRFFKKDFVQNYQATFIHRAVTKLNSMPFVMDDLIGYRRFALGIIDNPDSPFRQRWAGSGLIYHMPPPRVLIVHSEKYMSFTPRQTYQFMIPQQPLPFIQRHNADPTFMENARTSDHRQAALAMLEGKTVGDLRNEGTIQQLIEYAKRRKSGGAQVTGDGASWSEVGRGSQVWQDFHLALAEIQLPERVCICACVGFPPGTAISGKLLAGMVPKTVASSTGCLSFIFSSSSPLASPVIRRSPLWSAHSGAPSIWVRRYRAVWPSYGITTPIPDPNPQFPISRSPFCFQTGYALCAKRPSRPFPPPFLSPPSSSFSDPLTTHYLSQDKRLSVRGDLVRGLNNGDDAVLVAENYLAVNDGVGAWATKPRGHAALWSRLLLHFWALEVERDPNGQSELDPIGYLQRAYEETIRATTSPGEWLGTTTSVTALLHWKRDATGNIRPLLYVTNIGDCKVFVIRPSEKRILFRTKEQWHWFDCPMQLGTNSVDTPRKDAVLSLVDMQEDDLVVAVSDGILDNLWEHEILTIILDSLEKWQQGRHEDKDSEWAPPAVMADEQMVFLARELLKSALEIAQDPFAESPYMEKAVDEGLAVQGGKMDDISVVIGSCRRRQ